MQRYNFFASFAYLFAIFLLWSIWAQIGEDLFGMVSAFLYLCPNYIHANMNLNEIRTQLARLEELVAGWNETPSALERDLARDMLKRIYEAIRFAEPSAATSALPVEEPATEEPAAPPFVVAAPELPANEEVEEPAEEPAEELSVEPHDEPDYAAEEEPSDFDEMEPFDFDELMPLDDEPEEAVDEEFDEEFDEREEPYEEPCEASFQAEESVEVNDAFGDEAEEVVACEEEPQEEEEKVAEEPAVEVEEAPAAAPAEEPFVEPAVAPVEESVEEPVEEPVVAPKETNEVPKNLFDMEEIPVHRRSSRRALRSLYDEEPQSPATAPNPALAELVRQPVVELRHESEPVVPASSPLTEPVVEPSQPILNEVIHANETTLSDTVVPQPNIASSVGENSSLMKMVALNDSYLLRNELFEGDRVAYEFGMAQLDAQPSLDDALIYIAENYPQWNPNSDGVKLMLELLGRKFGEY